MILSPEPFADDDQVHIAETTDVSTSARTEQKHPLDLVFLNHSSAPDELRRGPAIAARLASLYLWIGGGRIVHDKRKLR